ncbi:MAG: 6-phosphogluconolactonase [Bacteroidetes bacterium GWF2_42_66]|nr:MAG: 6-phosphogluconolactonase [Bacteroidetes bacterium GWA2_42_15]OFY00397.1 MAG: 6-phosphogluconolactonase [Bacteroidetes bacterium GWE2_42_39]OFY47219.1 MAG: 6-phosphogluconolactonase [Bacteroidetes bacterium GWF2_42_66]
MEVKIYEDSEKVVKAFAKEFYKIVNDSNQKRFDIALSGGETPKILFQHLSSKYREKLPWQRLHFWWGDERCVAPDHEDSSFGVANSLLFSKIEIPAENIHRVKGENDPVTEAQSYGQQLQEQLNHRNGWPVFDLIILGMGKDGHTASIFPNQIKLLESEHVCEVASHPESGQKRVTLTGKVLNNAHRVYFLVTGNGKARRVSQIMNNVKKAQKYPAYHIIPENGDLYWYLDEDAAEEIR